MRILIVDDDRLGARMMEFLFAEQGYSVDMAENARGAQMLLERQPPHLIILDVNLPKSSGFELYTELRERGLDIPVIFVTAKGDLEDRVRGLNMGADDYIAKPFQPAELVARVEAVLRRYQKTGGAGQQSMHAGELTIDPVGLAVTLPDRRTVTLTPTEMRVLLHLARRSGQAVSRDEVLADVWGEHYDGDSNIVDVYIRRLRRKLERDANHPVLIQAARGVGYRLAAE
jgi:DNA-binding response OmpR family regulator